MSQSNLADVDWSRIAAPEDDGAANHLAGSRLPDVLLAATDGSVVRLAALGGRTVVYFYPMTGQPGVALPDGWDGIAGARGCTPQSCGFRDHFAEIREAGADRVFGLSVQDTDYQREAADRLHLPFPLLSDATLDFANAAKLPTLAVGGKRLVKRMTIVLDDGVVSKVFYPVFPPDKNAIEVLEWLRSNPR